MEILKTKCILAPPSREDGYRISVMSRHTLNDGLTPDARISQSSFHEWMKQLAPPDILIGSYYGRGLTWEGFALQYLNFLEHDELMPHFYHILGILNVQIVTLMCVEEKADHCHRRLLALHLQKINPHIVLVLD